MKRARPVTSVRIWLLAAALAVLALAAVPSGAGAVSVTNVTTVNGIIEDATPTAVVYRPPNTPDTEFGMPHYQPLTLRHLPSGDEQTVPVPAGRYIDGPTAARVFDDGVLFVSYPNGQFINGELDEWHWGDAAATSLGPANANSLDIAGHFALWSSFTNPNNAILRRDLTAASGTKDTVVSNGGTASVAANGDVLYTDRSTPSNVYRWRSPTDVTQISSTPDDQKAVDPVTDGTNIVWGQITSPCCTADSGSILLNGTALTDTDTPDGGINSFTNYKLRNGWLAFTRASQKQIWTRSPTGTLAQVGDGTSTTDVAGLRDVSDFGQAAYYQGPGGYYLAAAGQRPYPLGKNYYFVFWSAGHWYLWNNTKLDRLDTDTAITSKPDALTTATTANFKLASTAARNPNFTCTLDGSSVDCSSGAYTASNLADGIHTFTAASSDPDLNETDSTPASVTWRVDSTPPAPFVLTHPAEGGFVAAENPSFSWDAATDPNGSGVVSHLFALDGAGWSRGGDGAFTSTQPGPLTEGPHTWTVRATDAAGNYRDETGTFKADATPPSKPAMEAPQEGDDVADTTPTLRWGAASDAYSGLGGYRVFIDGRAGVDLGPAVHSYTPQVPLAEGDHYWWVVALDAVGNGASEDPAHFTVDTSPRSEPGPPGISINDGDQFTNDPDVTLTARWPKRVRNMLISNDGGFGGAEPTPVAFHVPWTLDSSGPERLPKTVYVRYLGGTAGNETYTDDIILDETSPSLLMARFAPASGKHRYAIKLRARDSVSGVHKAQLARHKRHPGRVLEYHRTLKVRTAARPRFVRVRDRAGNWSHWRKIARTG